MSKIPRTPSQAPQKENVIVSENTATPSLPATRCYMKSWGYYNKNKNIIIEQININNFLYNNNGQKGLVEVKDIKKEEETIGKGFVIGNTTYLFKNKRISNAKLFYNTPSMLTCKGWLSGEYKPRPYKEIAVDIRNALSEMFDFKEKQIDVIVSDVHIAQSWIKPIVNNAFFYGIDATKGGGKTTLGEIVYFLMRHGFLGGDISSAALVRLTDELDLNIFVDEIDQNQKDENVMGVMRKGQRRGNPFVRCEGRDNHPEAYDLFGMHGYSYRSEIEDAFMDRSLRTHTTKSQDYRVPIINMYKQNILKNLADELFLWFMDNISVVGCSEERGVAGKTKPSTFSRTALFNDLTKNFPKDQVKFLKSVFGRDTELTFLCLRVEKLLDIDVFSSIKKIMSNKAADLASSENFYFEELKELMFSMKATLLSKKLKDGDNAGMGFYPKRKLYAAYVAHLRKNLEVPSIGTKRFSSMLRDLGFVEGINLTSQRYENFPSPCLIFDEKIQESLEFSKKKEIEREFGLEEEAEQ